MYLDVPPCLVSGAEFNNCAKALYAWRVNALGEMPGEWAGWRLAGRYLVSPDGDRISPRRLRGILFAEFCREKLQNREKQVSQGQILAVEFGRLISKLRDPAVGEI